MPRYGAFEALLESSSAYSNPFKDVSVRVRFRAPSGRSVDATAFHEGGKEWRVRFAPDETGVWGYATSATNPPDLGLHDRKGEFFCAPSEQKGFIRPDPAHSNAFAFSDGTPFFGVGDTCYGLVTGIRDVQRKTYLSARARQGFNFIRFFASGYPFANPAEDWAWGGTRAAPDYDRLNPRYFQRLERILDELKELGLHAEILVQNFYSKPFNQAEVWTPERSALWTRTVVSRLSAHPAVFLWTVTNEYEQYPDGKYRYSASDDDWVRGVAALIHETDPLRHPTTAHPKSTAPQWDATLKDEKEMERGEMGRRFGGAAEIDVISQQHNGYGGATWRPGTPGYWDGSSEGVGDAIVADRRHGKPVVNTECGYQWREGHPNDNNRQSHGIDKCRKTAWRIFASGGAACATGFLGTWNGRDGNNFRDSRSGEEQPDPFVVEEIGWAAQARHLADFVKTIDFRKLRPCPEIVAAPNLCLGLPGSEYVVVAPAGGKLSLDLKEDAGIYSLEWLNPRTGAREGQTHLQGGAVRVVPTPTANDWVLHLRALRATTSEAGPLSWVVPEEGGTPRDPKRLLQFGPHEVMILAAAEEPESFLRHAVSRVDLIFRNSSRTEEALTIHLDLSGNGAREKLDPDGMGFGGMPRRNYVYVQAPGRPWKRIDGSVRGWVCTVTIPLEPGDTRLGLSPWYSYGDYLHYVDALPQHPHLQKAVAGKSDGGRPIWELTVTDPSVPAERKRRIFWHTREHAYETFGSFAMEGLVAYLLSDAAADWRKQYVVSIHPMTNVDGVAMGYEYRGSYDHPKPRETATAQATFGAMDRLKPHLTVTWHNWVAPRDVDVLFFTDDEGGKASRRAWDLFTQRFPSPRSVGHRWSNETDPLKHNYFGRKLTEDNVHQYALKRYGTQVWGWEMPWWNRDEGDPAEQARRHGADFGRAFFDVQRLLRAGPVPAAVELPILEVPLGVSHEFSVRGLLHVDARRAALIGEFVSPSGKRREAVGVFEKDAWRLSCTPDEAGTWFYLLRGEGVEHFSRGQLRCAQRP